MRTNEIENEIDEIKKWEEKIKRKDLKYEPEKYTYGFQHYKIIRSFDESIYICKLEQLKLMRNKAILKMQQNLITNLDQKQKKVKVKKEIHMKVHMLFVNVGN